jgi:hypothetical protein
VPTPGSLHLPDNIRREIINTRRWSKEYPEFREDVLQHLEDAKTRGCGHHIATAYFLLLLYYEANPGEAKTHAQDEIPEIIDAARKWMNIIDFLKLLLNIADLHIYTLGYPEIGIEIAAEALEISESRKLYALQLNAEALILLARIRIGEPVHHSEINRIANDSAWIQSAETHIIINLILYECMKQLSHPETEDYRTRIKQKIIEEHMDVFLRYVE